MALVKFESASGDEKLYVNSNHIVSLEHTELYGQPCTLINTVLTRDGGASKTYEVKGSIDDTYQQIWLSAKADEIAL